jgi:hypothetical protein
MCRHSALIFGVFYFLSAAGLSRAQIPPGFELIQITDDSDYDGPPSINNCGQIVFSKRINNDFNREEIFLWDRGTLTQITDDDVRDAFPDINDDGTVVWSRVDSAGGYFDIARWSDGEIELLTNTPDRSEYSPRINNLGHVVWNQLTEEGCAGSQIWFYDGTTAQPITNDEFSNQGEDINDHDEIVWTRYDFCVFPWVSTIMFHRNGITIPITIDVEQVQNAAINEQGHVSWQGASGIRLWIDGKTSVLTQWGSNPSLNSAGLVAFNRWHQQSSTYQIWLGESEKFRQITDNDTWNTNPVISELFEIAWGRGNSPDKDIELFTWAAGNSDVNFSGNNDLDDFAIFYQCLHGPGRYGRDCGCYRTDLNRDGSTDFLDFAGFQLAIGEE